MFIQVWLAGSDILMAILYFDIFRVNTEKVSPDSNMYHFCEHFQGLQS